MKIGSVETAPIRMNTAPRRFKARSVKCFNSLRFGHRLGIVIGERFVRLSLVRQRFHRCSVIETSSRSIKSDAAMSWADRVDAAVSAATEFLAHNGQRRVPVNIGLMGDDIAFRHLQLPPMTRKELPVAVRWEGERLFPFKLEYCFVYHRVIDRSQHRGEERIAVNVVAAQKEVVETVYNRFGEAGYEIGQVNFLPAMIADALTSLTNAAETTSSLLLHLDDDQSMALFLRRGQPEFFQRFMTSTNPDTDGMPLGNIRAVTTELLSFLDLYNSQRADQRLLEILMSGKYAEDQNIRDALEGATGLPCRTVFDEDTDPPELRNLPADIRYERFDVIAVGLADNTQHPLIPDKARAAADRRKSLFRVGIATAIGLLIIGNLHLQGYWQNQVLNRKLESWKTMIQAFEKSPGYQAYLRLTGGQDADNALGADSRRYRPSYAHLLLKELSRTIPDEITLNEIDLSRENNSYILRLEGNVRVSEFSPEIILARYVEALNRSAFFENASVADHTKKGDRGRFDLAFQLQMGARI